MILIVRLGPYHSIHNFINMAFSISYILQTYLMPCFQMLSHYIRLLTLDGNFISPALLCLSFFQPVSKFLIHICKQANNTFYIT
jgi:hypothetical protein